MKRRSSAVLFAAVFLGTIGLDWVTKRLALTYLPNHQITLVEGYAWLRLAFNRGVAFSALEGIPHFALGIGALLLLAVVLWSLRRLFATPLGTIALGLVAAGGMANAIDRLADGRVTDMISLWIWPVFNVADSAITVGVALLFFISPKKREAELPVSSAMPPSSDATGDIPPK